MSFYEFISQKTAILYLWDGGTAISLTKAQKIGLEGADKSEWKGHRFGRKTINQDEMQG